MDCLCPRTDESLVGVSCLHRTSAGAGGLTVSRSCRGLVGASCPTGHGLGQMDCQCLRTDGGHLGCHDP